MNNFTEHINTRILKQKDFVDKQELLARMVKLLHSNLPAIEAVSKTTAIMTNLKFLIEAGISEKDILDAYWSGFSEIVKTDIIRNYLKEKKINLYVQVAIPFDSDNDDIRDVVLPGDEVSFFVGENHYRFYITNDGPNSIERIENMGDYTIDIILRRFEVTP